MVSTFRLPHTLLNESFRLQFPFVFRQLQSLQLLHSGSPLPSTFAFGFSGPSVPRLITASRPLSDPRCFRFLSSASVLGSDYSASVSAFPFSSCLRLTVASSVLRFCFRFLGFTRSFLPGFPCILSRFRYSAFLYVSFRPSLIRSHSCSSGACFPLSLPAFSASSLAFFRPLDLCFRLLGLLFLPFRSSRFRLTVASSVLVFRFRFLRFPRSLLPGFPCIPSRFRYSASLYVSFRPSLIRSHSCSSGAYFLLSLSVFSASLPLSFVRFSSASGYSAFCFFLSVLPVSASQWLLRCPSSAFASYVFPVLSCLISHAFFPGFVLGFSVRFLSSFPASLPQLFHR